MKCILFWVLGYPAWDVYEKNYDYLVAQEQKEGSRDQKTMLEHNPGFAINLNNYPSHQANIYTFNIFFYSCAKTIIAFVQDG